MRGGEFRGELTTAVGLILFAELSAYYTPETAWIKCTQRNSIRRVSSAESAKAEIFFDSRPTLVCSKS
jgi:hypothetical protein